MARRASFKRWNPILGEWVIIAPATSVRPWSGAVIESANSKSPEFDPSCYLCPGMERAGGAVNPDYKGVYVFDNDFATLSLDYTADSVESEFPGDAPARGVCRVVCFSPYHNKTLPMMGLPEVSSVVDTLNGQFAELSSIPEIEHVMIFENRGTVIGVSNPHPHGQIYAPDFVPRIPMTRYRNAADYKKEHGQCLFCTVLDIELSTNRRIVCENDDFVAFVPPFARFTFETMIISRRHIPTITELSTSERHSLAAIYHDILIRYDNLFKMSFPNITIFQNAPCSSGLDPEPYHFHIEFMPPLRSRDKLKYLAGFESGGGNIINPSLPDESAEALRSLPAEHYTRIS